MSFTEIRIYINKYSPQKYKFKFRNFREHMCKLGIIFRCKERDNIFIEWRSLCKLSVNQNLELLQTLEGGLIDESENKSIRPEICLIIPPDLPLVFKVKSEANLWTLEELTDLKNTFIEMLTHYHKYRGFFGKIV